MWGTVVEAGVAKENPQVSLSSFNQELRRGAKDMNQF